MEVHSVEDQLLLTTGVYVGFRGQLLVGDLCDDFKGRLDGGVQGFGVFVVGVQGVERVGVGGFVAEVYSWAEIADEGGQQGGQLGGV